MNVLVIKTNDVMEVKEIDGSLKSMQEVVGGRIEIVYPREAYQYDVLKLNHCFVCDEEGLCKNKELNILGTTLYNGNNVSNPIVGDIFICEFAGEDLVGLTDKQIEEYKEKFEGKLQRIRSMKKIMNEDK